MYYQTNVWRYRGVYTCKVYAFPGIKATGSSREEAEAEAMLLIEREFRLYIRERLGDFPFPECSYTDSGLEFGVVKCAKIALFNAAMAAGDITQTARAHRLNVHIPSVDRMLDLTHNSRIEILEAALLVYGERLRLQMFKTSNKSGKK